MKRILLTLLLLPALAAGCGGGSKSSSATSTTSTSTSSSGSSSHGSMNVAGKSSVTLTMHSYFFSPNTLSGTPGQKLTVNLKNTASVVHNFSVTGESANVNVSPGQTATATLTFPKSGSVTFFCKIHKALGMVGTLKVAGSSGMTTTTPTTPTTTSGGGGYGY